MLKEVRNNINRTTNFETANISKIATSAADQITAIKKLKKAQKFEFLPNSIKKIANLRIENPYASLQDLANISDEKISKSGINHRLHKLLEISKELELVSHGMQIFARTNLQNGIVILTNNNKLIAISEMLNDKIKCSKVFI